MQRRKLRTSRTVAGSYGSSAVGPALLFGALLMAATLLAATADAGRKDRPRYDPGLEPPRPAPMQQMRVPSPGTSSPSSPIRDYIYRAPADAGSVRDRLAPPSITRPGPRGYQ